MGGNGAVAVRALDQCVEAQFKRWPKLASHTCGLVDMSMSPVITIISASPQWCSVIDSRMLFAIRPVSIWDGGQGTTVMTRSRHHRGPFWRRCGHGTACIEQGWAERRECQTGDHGNQSGALPRGSATWLPPLAGRPVRTFALLSHFGAAARLSEHTIGTTRDYAGWQHSVIVPVGHGYS